MKLRIIVTVAALFFAAYTFAKTPTISQQALLENQMSSTPHILVDVRTPEEYNDGHIKGAINIPFDEIKQNQDKLNKLKGATLVVYCRSGRRASLFEQSLQAQGFNLLHLNGDMQLWQKNKMPLIKN